MWAVRDLALSVLARHPIPRHHVLGHSDVAPLRKEDPGELFDWAWLAGEGVGLWPTPRPCQWSDADFLSVLEGYGYDLQGPKGTDTGSAQRAAIVAFERHFRPARMAGEPDDELKAVLNGLIDTARRSA